jgi:membrane-associated phospholipid phosphatase
MDLDLFRLLNDVPHPEWLTWVFWFITCLGLGWVQAIGLVAVIVAGRFRYRKWWGQSFAQKLFWPGLWSYALSGGLNQVIKRLVNRPRPPDLGFKAPDELIYAYSFPSGHAATSFALAYVVWWATRKTRWSKFGWAAWIVAALIGYSRIYRGLHYPGDVLGGALLGVGCAWLVCRFFERRYQASGRSE